MSSGIAPSHQTASLPNGPLSTGARTIIECKGLHKAYRDGTRTIEVLRGVDFTVAMGETIAITGRSGSGKSTLLHILGLLDTPTSGQLYFRGNGIEQIGRRSRNILRSTDIGFVFQAYHLIHELSALENVLLAAKISGKGSRKQALELLSRVGLEDRMSHRPTKLSGGEKQRVAIARALMGSPSVLLADEPTGNLDATTAQEVEDLLFEVGTEHDLAMVLVTHEKGLAARCNRALHLENGKLQRPVPDTVQAQDTE